MYYERSLFLVWIISLRRYTDEDGNKPPKMDSSGAIPISDELLVAMSEPRNRESRVFYFNEIERGNSYLSSSGIDDK
jgi:hypothetical protein